ncbi:RagB/SusD family nutrient uptake outer membrane protein, partial [Parabacteroides goldsteinii]
MKLTNIVSLAFLIFLFGMMSCNVLDTEPFESYDEATVWGSKSTADAFVTGTMSSVMYGYVNGNQTTWEERTSNAVHSNGGIGFVRETMDRYSGDGGFGNFGTIRNCNLIIEKVTEYTGKGLSEAEGKELVAKGKLLRALTYYQQARTMGRFVWVDRVLAPADTASNGLMMPTTKTTTESYTYILNDLDAAIPDLPASVKSGELSRNMAYAFKSEIALQAAAYETDANKKKEWLKASIDAANAVEGCSLASAYGNVFNETDRYSNEIIFAIYRDKANTNCEAIVPMQNVIPNTSNDGLQKNGCGPLFKTNGGQPFIGWLWWAPTQNLVDAYEVIDEATGNGVAWNESSQFKNNVTVVEGSAPDWAIDQEKAEVLYYGNVKGDKSISEIMYTNRDARFYDTFVYDGATWWSEDIRLTVKGNLWRKVNGGLGPHIGLTNYFWRKGVYHVEPRLTNATPTNYHFVVTRYGRVLLNKAEAILWLAGMGEGNYSEAVDICNQTRTVHGKLPAKQVNSLEEAWKFYKQERRCELPMENDYYWTLLRWGKHGGYANNGVAPGGKIAGFTEIPTYIEITNDRKSFYIGKVTHGDND